MAQEKKLIPKRRFKEFQNDGDWEPRKVEGYATFLKGNGLSWNDITKDGQQECILYGNLYTDYGMIAEDVVYKTNTQLKNGIYSKFGDVLIPASDTTPTGLARATSIEKTGVLLGGDINVIRPCDEIDGSCLSLAINTNRKELIKLIKGTTVKHIYNSDIKNIYITLPKSIEEQRKLVLLFKDIDNLITLQQRKLEKIKSMKKAYLYEMFPVEGESKPKRRFKGFSDDWKLCEFENIFKLSQGLQIEISKRYRESGANRYFYITNEFLKEGSNEKYYIDSPPQSVICSKEDILMTRTGNTGIVVTDVEGCFHNNFFKIKYDSNQFNQHFICQFLSTEAMQKRILNSAGSSTIPDLSHKSFYKLNGFFPTLDEQNKISCFLNEVDNLITIHQHKLDKLKNLKKAYLNEMFI